MPRRILITGAAGNLGTFFAVSGATVDGRAVAPETPGLGIDWDHDALERMAVR